MSAMIPKTRAQQRLEWLESLNHPLTDDESDTLRRSLHAVYWHNRKPTGPNAYLLAKARSEELVTLRKVEAEMPVKKLSTRHPLVGNRQVKA